MSKKYSLYPKLSEEAQEEANQLLNSFKQKLKEIADEVIGDLYCDTIHYIESDSWANFANQLMEGFRNYNNRKIQNKFDFKQIRKQIYKEYRDELIEDLNQDLVKEIKDLKEQLAFERGLKRDYY